MLTVDELLNVLKRLWREQKYTVYSNPRDIYLDLKLLAHFLNKRAENSVNWNGNRIEITSEGLSVLKTYAEKYTWLISPELKTRLALVLIG